MSNAARLEALVETARQREFERDFIAGWESYETWDEAVMRRPVTAPGDFVVAEEDVLAYNRALGETDPLMVDPAYAREHAPRGTVLVHPLFTTAIAFWFARRGGQGSWICTPGARNPFQRIVVHQRLEVGDRVNLTQENSDRFVRRGMHYLTTHGSIHDQHGKLRVEVWGTLILPPTRDDVRRFATA